MLTKKRENIYIPKHRLNFKINGIVWQKNIFKKNKYGVKIIPIIPLKTN